MPMKYDEQTRSKAVRLVTEHAESYTSQWEAITTVSKRLGISPEALRRWVRQAEIDTGDRDGVSTAMAAENRELKRKNRELEQTIEVLKAATSFFVAESVPQALRAGRGPHRNAGNL